MAHLNVISQEMNNDQLVMKNYIEDFNTKSQLIVYESQEAIFFKNGQALDLFPSGRHTLDTDNLPFLKRIFGKIFGGATPFPCEVFFINKVSVLDLLWGTDTPIPLEDPKYHLLINVRSNGQTGIRIKDSRRFVVKIVGQLPEVTVDTVRRAIKGAMMASIKETIATAIVENGVSILEISTKLSELSALVQAKLNAKIDDLGIAIEHFEINSILAGDQDLVKLREAKERRLEMTTEMELEAQKLRMMSEAKAYARSVEGYSYYDERRFDVLENAAKNEGAAGGLINMGVGMGVGVGVARDVGQMTNEMRSAGMGMQQPAVQQSVAAASVCSGCGQPIAAGAKFCPNCGQKQEPKQKFCPECGSPAPAGGKFCTNCGTKLE